MNCQYPLLESPKALSLKIKKAIADLFDAAQNKSPKTDQKSLSHSSIEYLVYKAIQKTKISISDVHVRIENHGVGNRFDFALGLMIKKLLITSIGDDDNVNTYKKKIGLDGLSIYFDNSGRRFSQIFYYKKELLIVFASSTFKLFATRMQDFFLLIGNFFPLYVSIVM